MESSNEEELNFEEIKESYNEDVPYNDKSDLRNLDIYPCAQMTNHDTPQNNTIKSKSRCLSDNEKRLIALFKDISSKNPRKEFIRLQTLRGFKRTIRECLAGKTPKIKFGEVHTKYPKSLEAWKAFKQFIDSDIQYFEIVGKTEEGPNSEAKSKRDKNSDSNSYNNQYCSEFFSRPENLHAFTLFIELVFSVMDCKILSKKFGLTPVSHIPKSCNKCIPTWEYLKSYLIGEMIQSLNERATESQLPS